MIANVGGMIRVVELAADQTHELRRTQLRGGTGGDAVVFDGDDEPSTFHLGAMFADDVVSISTWLPRRYPDLPAHPGHQLRGMATLPSARGSGVSAAVLHAGIERCSERGSSVVWARSRVTALSFYERHGFEPRGHEYIDLTTGLPHRDVVVFV